MNKFDNFSTAEIEAISNGLCMYTNSITNDPNKANRKVEAAVILDLLQEIDDRNQDRIAAINTEINMLESDGATVSMDIDDFINSFNDDFIVNDDLDEYNT